ncbi:MAG: nucleotide exchange factor GrpE [Myxococcota bacterium]|nr:nucleotide exchange factor GrpE [Myxococcota bacterium]
MEEEESEDEVTSSFVTPDRLDERAELEALLSAERDRSLRLAADMDNLRKRSRKEVEDALGRGRAEVLLEILPVVDSIDLALSSNAGGEAASATAVLDGVAMVRRLFLATVERFGVTPVATIGKSFDPNFHEAVAQVTSDEHEIGRIVHEMRKGYVMGDKLLRPAMVAVSKGSASGEPSSQLSEEPLA